MNPPTRRTMNVHSGFAAAAAFLAQPIPTGDELIVVPIHYALCIRLAAARGVRARDLPWKQIKKIIWYGAGARMLANFSLGFLPVVGGLSSSATAIALTEYLGRYLDDVLANPTAPAPEVTFESMRNLFSRAGRSQSAPASTGNGTPAGANDSASAGAPAAEQKG